MRCEDSLVGESGIQDVVAVVVIGRYVPGGVYVREEGCYAGEF